MRWWKVIALLVLAGAACWLLWSWLFPSPEKVIRQRLGEVARAASFAANEGELAKLSNAQKLASYLVANPEIQISGPGQGRYRFESRDDVFRAAMAARQAIFSLQLEFLDVTVMVDSSRQSATVSCTALGRLGGEREPLIQELRMIWQKEDGYWLIRRIETVKVLT